MTNMDSLVRIFPNALSVKECDELVAKFEASPSLQRKQAEGEMSFTQIDFLEHFWAETLGPISYKGGPNRYRKVEKT